MIVKVETGMVRDLGYIESMEIKAQEYPLPMDAIKCYIDDAERRAYVANIQGRKVGAALVQWRDTHTVITRVSVHPDFRNIGVSKELMLAIEKDAWKKQHHLLKMYIPSYKVDDPTDPDYLLWWLEKSHFKAVGCETESYFRYGRWWDAYVFERAI